MSDWRRRRLLAVGLALMALAPVAWAKDKEPVPDWAVNAAKTPTPEKVGDAAAVILFSERVITVDAQNRGVKHWRFAVRILKPQGREYGYCEASYDVDSKLRSFRAWTITADGKQFQAKDEDFRDFGEAEASILQFSERVRVVHPPATDPGAVVVCETESELPPYMHESNWFLQNDVPVVHEALELVLPPGGHYAEAWRGIAPVKPTETAEGHLRWVVENEPAVDLEQVRSAPAWGALAARASVKWGDLAVHGNPEQWKALGVWEGGLQEHRWNPTPEITAKAQALTAGAPDFYTKLERITRYVQDHIRYFIVEKGIGGYQAHYAADIYRNEYGDCKDKTTLLVSMLDAIGVKAHYFHVNSERGVIAPETPSLIGDHMITAIEIPAGVSDKRLQATVKTADGKELLIFDPTDEWTPVGLINSDLQGAYGMVADGDASQVLKMPVLPADTGGIAREGKFALAADGALTGELKEQRTGDDATWERLVLKRSDAKEVHEWLEHRLSADLPGIEFQDYKFAQAAELDKPLDLEVKISAANYAHASGPLLLLRPRIVGSHVHAVKDVMDGKKREYPIELGNPGVYRDSFDVTLPEGYKLDDAPDPVNVDVGFASYKSSVTALNGNTLGQTQTLHYESEYVVRDVEIPPAKAGEFRKLESAIMSSEKSAAVLKKNE